MYLDNGPKDNKFYKNNIRNIKQDMKHGHDYLYNDNHGNSAFKPIAHVYKADDFRDYNMND